MRAFSVYVHEANKGVFWADVEELPRYFASGDTLDELELDVKQAIEALKEARSPVPSGHEASEPKLRRREIDVA